MPVTLKIFIALSETRLKIRKVAVYRFLISLLVPKLVRFEDMKTIEKIVQETTRFWIKSIKIDKISDVMSRTSGSKQLLKILYLGEYTCLHHLKL